MKIGIRKGLLIAAGVGYFALLWPEVMRAAPENDLWWMLPTMSHHLQGRSPVEALFFLLGAFPLGFAQPILKVFLFAVSRFFGPETRFLLLASMVIHLGNAGLLGLLVRQWGLSVRTAALSGVIFLAFFGHFHAVLWPTASQHLLALTTLLALLNLYFWAEARVRRGQSAAAGFAAAAGVALMASVQRSTLIALAVIAADLIAFSRNAEERAGRFRRWSWIFLLYAIYPIVMVTSAGDPVVTEALRKLSIPGWLRMLVVTDPLFPSSTPWGIRAAILLGMVLAGLWVVWGALRSPLARRLDQAGWRLWAAGGTGLLLLWGLKDHRQLLFPYNGFIPFLSPFSILLDPLRAAFSMDSAEPYYYLAPQVSAGTFLLAFGAVAAFWRVHVRRNRELGLLLIWYLMTLGVMLHQNSSLPLRTPSRYFIYLSPVMAVVVACGMEGLAERIFRRRRTREVALYGVTAALCLVNVAAIRVALFRSRLANTALFYDDLRTVRIVEESAGKAQGAWVGGVVRMPIREAWRDFPLSVPPDYDNLAVAAAALGAGPLRAGEGPAAGLSAYHLEGTLVRNPLGRSLEPFAQLLEAGNNKLGRGEIEGAAGIMEEAVRRPPFLIGYLTQGVRISDLRWVTGGLDLADWLNRVIAAQREPGQPDPAKLTRVKELVQAELRSYVQAVVLLAYVYQKERRMAESQYWLSQAQFLERDPGTIVHDMNMLFLGTFHEDMKDFLKRVEDPLFLLEPYNGKKEDYAVGRFLMRLLLGWDIRSSWDKRFSRML